MRHLLEGSTGIVTGSDSRSNRTLSASLLRCGFRGEGIADSSVWVVKSHFPERMGYLRFRTKRVILLVRNPFDSIESYFHMGLTNTHDKMLTKDVMQSEPLQDLWRDFVLNEASVWAAFHLFWLQQSVQIPVLFVRFEDLLLNENATMAEILQFMQNASPQTSVASSCVAFSSAASAPENRVNGLGGPGYAQKSSTRKIGKSLAALSTLQQREVTATTGYFMDLFGYQYVPEGGNEAISRLNVLPLEMGKISLAMAPLPGLPAGLGQSRDGGAAVRSYDLTWKLDAGPLSGTGGLIINNPVSIRAADDKFGRGMTDIRKGLTSAGVLPG